MINLDLGMVVISVSEVFISHLHCKSFIVAFEEIVELGDYEFLLNVRSLGLV